MSYNKIKRQHEEIIKNLTANELLFYLEKISKRKIGSLGFIKHDQNNTEINIEDYNMYSEIEEEIVTILANKYSSNVYEKEYKKTLAEFLTVASDYNELVIKYVDQQGETKLTDIKGVVTVISELYKSIKKDYIYLSNTLNLFYLTYSAPEFKEEQLKLLEEPFNMLIENIYNNLVATIKTIKCLSVTIERIINNLEAKKEVFPTEKGEYLETISDFYNLCCCYIESFEKLKANPFEDGFISQAETMASIIFNVEVNDLNSFEESLEREEDKTTFNLLKECFITNNNATYDFDSFKIICS